MVEEWRVAPGLPGYEVSSFGRVRCLPRVVTRSDGSSQTFPGHLKRTRLNRLGYVTAKFGRYGPKLVHRLVLRAFVGEPPPGHICAHGDGNRANPRLDNLRWATPQENSADALLHGTRTQGERHGCAKLTEAEVRNLRAEAAGVNQSDLAAKYGISQAQVSNILLAASWRSSLGDATPIRRRGPKLPDEKVRVVRALGRNYWPTEVSRMTGVERTAVSRILSGALYRDVA